MTDAPEITTTPLWPLTPVQAQRLVDIARRRELDAATGGDTRPPGLRLSTPCATKRVKSEHEQRLRFTLDPGLARRGFFAEDLFEAVMCAPGAEFEGANVQVPVVWGGGAGTTAWDLTLDARPISLKSIARGDSATPTAENLEQDDRMMTGAGMKPGAYVDTYMVNTGTLTVTGPFRHTLTEDRHAACLAELKGCIDAQREASRVDDPTRLAWWNDEDAWLEIFGLECTCGSCTLRPTLDGNRHVEGVIHRYDNVRGQIADLEEQLAPLERKLKWVAAEQLFDAGEGARKIDAYTKSWTVAFNKNGTPSIRRRKEVAPEQVTA